LFGNFLSIFEFDGVSIDITYCSRDEAKRFEIDGVSIDITYCSRDEAKRVESW
jgi:hypothetical protein